MVPNLVTVSGLARFYLKSAHPEFELYVTPVQINPANQVLPITDPPEYGTELVDAVGLLLHAEHAGGHEGARARRLRERRFSRGSRGSSSTSGSRCSGTSSRSSTRGCSTSTSARSTSRRTRCGAAWTPRTRTTSPSRTRRTPTTWRTSTSSSTACSARRIDSLDENTTLIVLSDHGFAPYYREVPSEPLALRRGLPGSQAGCQARPASSGFSVSTGRGRAPTGSGSTRSTSTRWVGRRRASSRPGSEAEALIDEIAGEARGSCATRRTTSVSSSRPTRRARRTTARTR